MPKRISGIRIKLIRKLLNKILSIESIRKHFIFIIKQDYFHELEYAIPLMGKYWAQILENDAYDSFSEIFIRQEYKKFVPKNGINRILDIGSNYGYFSLWLQSEYPEKKICSLMIEPSRRCHRSLNNLINQPIFEGRFKWIDGAIANPVNDRINFFVRPFMASSTFHTKRKELDVSVEVIKVEKITKLLPPPYDLIKCDIEGSEWEFINHYSELLLNCKYFLLEWHSWHNGGGSRKQIRNKLKELGFSIYKESSTTKAFGRDGDVGLILFENKCI